MHILPIYAALLGLLFVQLSLRTIRLRRRLQIGVGFSDNPEMLRGMRAHANFAEYAPLTLLLIHLVEIQGAASLFVHALGTCLIAGRCLHAYGISQLEERFVFRVSGMAMTFTSILSSCAFLLYNAIVTR